MTLAAEIRDIIVEAVLPHAPEVVWKTLTTADLIGQWLMPNDFEAVVGKKFNFRTTPMGDWDGVVHCEVLELIENRRLVYSWKGGSGENVKYGSRLDTTVTWTVVPVAAGTRLKMVHAGFRLPANQAAFDAMSPGWGRVLQAVERVAAALETRS
ncbi:MAG: SRPBCC family protein [Methylocella sp.]